MKFVWIMFLILCMVSPVSGQSADTVEPSKKVQPRKVKPEEKKIPEEKADTPKKAIGESPAAPSAPSAETEKKKAPVPVKKPFIDENGDGLNDSPSTAVKRNSTSTNRPEGRSMDRFTDPDGDGINDGRGFERDKRDRGRNALEENLKEKNRLREKDKK